MILVSEIKTTAPEAFKNELQELAYTALRDLDISFERVDTTEVITMDDCALVNRKLDMQMVKTLFLCNRQKTALYLLVTLGCKSFKTKEFSNKLDIARVSFAPAEMMENKLGTKIGAATIFSALLDKEGELQIILDADVASSEWYGCSDGTTTGYMKVRTERIVNDFLRFTGHTPRIIEL